MPEKKRKGQVTGQEGPELQHSAFLAARAAIKGEQLVNTALGTAQLKAAGMWPARDTAVCLRTGCPRREELLMLGDEHALARRGCPLMFAHCTGCFAIKPSRATLLQALPPHRWQSGALQASPVRTPSEPGMLWPWQPQLPERTQPRSWLSRKSCLPW